MIVGRDTDALDEAGVCRAAIESLAENFSDGVVAPLFWLAVGGLPGGRRLQGDQHRRQHDRPQTRASSRLRLGGGAPRRSGQPAGLAAGGAVADRRAAAVLPQALRRAMPGARCCATRGKHRSPNAGWPEAAMAGALGLALAGPRVYGGVMVDDRLDGRRPAARRRAPTSAARLRSIARLRHAGRRSWRWLVAFVTL